MADCLPIANKIGVLVYIRLLLGIYVNVTILTCWGYDQILDIGISLLVIHLSPFYFQYIAYCQSNWSVGVHRIAAWYLCECDHPHLLGIRPDIRHWSLSFGHTFVPILLSIYCLLPIKLECWCTSDCCLVSM